MMRVACIAATRLAAEKPAALAALAQLSTSIDACIQLRSQHSNYENEAKAWKHLVHDALPQGPPYSAPSQHRFPSDASFVSNSGRCSFSTVSSGPGAAGPSSDSQRSAPAADASTPPMGATEGDSPRNSARGPGHHACTSYGCYWHSDQLQLLLRVASPFAEIPSAPGSVIAERLIDFTAAALKEYSPVRGSA